MIRLVGVRESTGWIPDAQQREWFFVAPQSPAPEQNQIPLQSSSGPSRDTLQETPRPGQSRERQPRRQPGNWPLVLPPKGCDVSGTLSCIETARVAPSPKVEHETYPPIS